MDLAYFRLNSGEWVVGEDKGYTEDEGVKIGRPRVLSRLPIANGEVGIVLLPFNLLNPAGDVIFHPDSFQAYVLKDDYGPQLEKQYIESTTDIVIASRH